MVPGWDCHGLPIEHNVDKQLGAKKKELTPVEVRQACRAYAANFVDIQKEEFKRFGVAGQWETPYLTMNSAYEARIARECGEFALAGDMFLGKNRSTGAVLARPPWRKRRSNTMIIPRPPFMSNFRLRTICRT